MRKKQLLLIGEEGPLAQSIVGGLGSRWAVTHVHPGNNQASSTPSHTLYLDDSLEAVEEELKGKEFMSIVVLPVQGK